MLTDFNKHIFLNFTDKNKNIVRHLISIKTEFSDKYFLLLAIQYTQRIHKIIILTVFLLCMFLNNIKHNFKQMSWYINYNFHIIFCFVEKELQVIKINCLDILWYVMLYQLVRDIFIIWFINTLTSLYYAMLMYSTVLSIFFNKQSPWNLAHSGKRIFIVCFSCRFSYHIC